MRKLVSISVVLALLLTFAMPLAVGAQEDCGGADCPYTSPEGPPLPEKTTKTMAGAAVWSFLGITDVMGKAVCTVTGLMAGNLGGWSDEIGIIATEAVQGVLLGVADLVEAAIAQFVPDFAEIGGGLADIFRALANAIKVNQTA